MSKPRANRSLYIVLAALLLLLPLMAVLQYNWIGEVAEAERTRLREGLNRSANQLAEEFSREMLRIITNFQVRKPPDGTDISDLYSQRYDQWSYGPHPSLIRRIFLVRRSGLDLQLFEFDPSAHRLQATVWPEGFEPLHDALAARLENTSGRRLPPPRGEIVGGKNPLIILPTLGDPGPRGGFARGERPDPPQPEGWTLIEFDYRSLTEEFIPLLVTRYFADDEAREYKVAIVSLDRGQQLIYNTADFTESDLTSPDLSIRLFAPEGGRRGGPPPRGGGNPRGGSRSEERGFGMGGPGGALTFAASWSLLVKHRSGSLDAAIAGFRQRNLLISFGILLLLTASIVLVVISSHRARALAQLQMDFVARVSHELRTPLTIIRSAAYNISKGVVSDEKEVREYAQMVETEGQRLSTMLDQILTFSRTESGKANYELRALDVAAIVDRVLINMNSALGESRYTIDRKIDANLPPVKADERAITECIQNLITNATKYGKSGEASRIQVEATQDAKDTVQIKVHDYGPGIPSSDLDHVFDAFFRGSNVKSDMPGSGLGLHLVKQLMEAQSGRVTVDSELGTGTTFTLHLPVFKEPLSENTNR